MVSSSLRKNMEQYNNVKRELEKRINMLQEADKKWEVKVLKTTKKVLHQI